MTGPDNSLRRAIRQRPPGGPRHARGAALVVSLLLLVTLTIIGVTGMRNASMEERMAGNLRDRNTAFQAAEGAVRDGEVWLAEQDVLPVTGTTAAAPVYADTVTLPALGEQTQAWWNSDTNAQAVAQQLDAASIAHQPRYVIQYVEFICDSPVFGCPDGGEHFYRVTGHGTGQSEAARAVIQTTFTVDSERFIN